MNKIAIIGYGELGKAIHKILENKSDLLIDVWDKKDLPAQAGGRGQKTLADAICSAEAVFVCVPSWCVREALLAGKRNLDKKTLVVCLAKGIEEKTLKTMDSVLDEVLLKSQPFSILSGPMLAEELMAGKNGFAAVAVKNKKDFSKITDIFDETILSVEYSNDLHGVALCGILKNIYALGLGIVDGLELGGNSKGKFLTMAITEMLEIMKVLGGKRETVLGVAGIGDLIATGFSKYSRNRGVGEELAKTGICCLESEGFKSIGLIAKLLGKKADKLPFFNILKSIILKNQKPAIAFKKTLKYLNLKIKFCIA